MEATIDNIIFDVKTIFQMISGVKFKGVVKTDYLANSLAVSNVLILHPVTRLTC